MHVNQTQDQRFIAIQPVATGRRRWRPWPRRIPRGVWLGIAIFLAFCFLGRNEYSATEATNHAILTIVRPWDFDLTGWTIDAWRAKGVSLIVHPAEGLTPSEATNKVRTYLEQAQAIWALEEEINRLLSSEETGDVAALQQDLEELRQRQAADRATVEAIVQSQVGGELVDAGIALANRPMPPVLFTFAEPPRKLVVSPRDQIVTVYARILDSDMSVAEIEASERAIWEQEKLSAYITNIGGLGVFPTMVIDRASLGWVLSTVAHEWVHNYLTFFPLGANYSRTSELTILNESVATIIGDEVGAATLRDYYPDLAPPPTPPLSQRVETEDNITSAPETNEPPPFDFHYEMRITRLHVDELLAAGKVEEAESYMDARRRLFVENGYPLRVLNQAYFAFHGSYVDSPSSTSPIGPKLEQLRAQSPDLKSFLETVRWFTSEADLDAALQAGN